VCNNDVDGEVLGEKFLTFFTVGVHFSFWNVRVLKLSKGNYEVEK
jgi:hypothetical protein